ncbi:MAG: amino acid permease [Saprospiraceae bacterium]
MENSPTELKRVIGVAGLAFTVINGTIGAGIYVLPAIIGIELGTASILGFILCALMFTAIILCYVEVGSKIKTSGGSYAYVEAAFGPMAGFVTNWMLFFGWGILSSAAVLNMVADSLTLMFPILSAPGMRVGLFVLLVGFMVLLNVRSVKGSVAFVSGITLAKLIPLFAIIIFGAAFIDGNNLKLEALPSISSFENTAIILFFAFAGFESALSVSGELKDPKRTIPRGILLGGLLILLTYILIQVVVQGILGAQLIEFKAAPLAAVAQRIVGPIGATILLLAAVLSGFGAIIGDVLLSPRLLYAAAKDGLFPAFLKKIHPRFGTPYWAIIAYASLIFIFSVGGEFKQLAILASGALLLVYLGVILSTIKLRMTKQHTIEKTYKVPGGLTIPILGIIAIIWVLSNLSMQENGALLIFLVAILVLYFVTRKLRKPQQDMEELPK